MPLNIIVQYLLKTRQLNFDTRPDQITVSKSPSVWFQKDVLKVLRRHKGEKILNKYIRYMASESI